MIRTILAAIVAATLFLPVHAQNSVPAAELFRVNEGVFTVALGEVRDMTDRMVLLAVVEGRNCLAIKVAGRTDCLKLGHRYDLKWKHAPFHLGKTFADKRSCFLDVIGIETTKGATPQATFRLHCA